MIGAPCPREAEAGRVARAGAVVHGLASWPRPSLDLPLAHLDLALIAQPGVLLAAATALVLAPLALYLPLSRE